MFKNEYELWKPSGVPFIVVKWCPIYNYFKKCTLFLSIFNSPLKGVTLWVMEYNVGTE